ncbi:MAG: hypothetical protein M0P57_10305 [Syntrophales bacterium]|jgi:hypothetical protein|nr:hypothetical protein [Syntrophales bacterium]
MAQTTILKKKKPWTSREINNLKKMALAKMPIQTMGKRLGRTPRAIYDKAFKENISLRSYKQLSWTSEEIRELKKMIKKRIPTRLIGERLGRSPRAIYNKAFKEKISFRSDKAPRYHREI